MTVCRPRARVTCLLSANLSQQFGMSCSRIKLTLYLGMKLQIVSRYLNVFAWLSSHHRLLMIICTFTMLQSCSVSMYLRNSRSLPCCVGLPDLNVLQQFSQQVMSMLFRSFYSFCDSGSGNCPQ